MNSTLEGSALEQQQNTEGLREALLDLERSKRLEEETRIESEYILACLNALSRVGLDRNALRILLEELQPVFEYDEACVLVPDPEDPEYFIVTASTHECLQASRWPTPWLQSRVTVDAPLLAFNVQTLPMWQMQTEAMQRSVRSALHLALRPAPKPAYLICTHPQVGFFSHKHSKRAIRFAPMLAQALINIETTKELANINQRLQQEVEERRKAQTKLVAVQEELIATARQAGKAEIATNVVHNVGNVLNSVNVGSEALQRQLKGMPLTYLRRMADMVAEHQSFLADHDKMKLLPSVIEKLTHKFEQQHQGCSDELTTLQTHVEHIANIVKLQQASAGYQEVLEDVELTALMESALTLSCNDLSERDIVIDKHYQTPLHHILDKHQVLQILVNLISNAKQALMQLPAGEGHLGLSIEVNAEQILFKVKDNGEGIAAENLEKIFAHGYTTREQGHGFGLHGSALNAKQMGGTLTVVSAGCGQGAEFTLRIPARSTAVC